MVQDKKYVVDCLKILHSWADHFGIWATAFRDLSVKNKSALPVIEPRTLSNYATERKKIDFESRKKKALGLR